MPLQFLDEAHKRRTLISKGFDPEQFDVDVETGNIVPRFVAPPPAVTPQPDLTATIPEQAKPEPMSPLKSAAIGAGTSVLPAAGGLGAAIAAQPVILPIAAATGPAAPLTELGLSIGAAMGGGAAVNWLQNKLMPQSMQQTVAEAQQSNPLSFMGGSIAGQLPTMAANPRGVLEAGKTGLKVANNLIKPSIAPLAISAAEKANLANVGVGVGIPAGELMLDATTGKPIDPAMAAMSLAGGAILNKPSSLANKIFKLNPSAGVVKPSVSPEQFKQLEKSVGPNTTTLKDYGPILESQTARREISRGIIPPGYNVEIDASRKNPDVAKSIEDTILSPEIRTKLRAKGALPERYKQALPKEGIFKKLGIKQDVVRINKSAAESAEAMFDTTNPSVRARDRLETGGDNPQGGTTFKTGPESLDVGLPKAKTPEQIANERESNYQLFAKLLSEGKAAEASKFSSQLGETYYFNRRYTTEKSSGGAKAEFPPTEEGKLTAQDKELLANRRKNFQGISEGENPIALSAETRLKKEVEKAGTEQKLKATKEFFDIFNKIFGPLRNVKQTLDGRLINKETGKPVRGEIEASREGMTALLSKVNPNTATPDTVPHEFIHGWFTDFKNSPNRYERAAANNLERAIENNPEFKADNQRRVNAGKAALSPEEYIAETGGYEVFNRAVNLDGNQGTLKQSWKDFISQVKLKLDRGSVEDIQRYVANRFIKDPSFGETMASKYANVNQANEGEDTTQVDNQNTTDDNLIKSNEQGNEQRSTATAKEGQGINQESGPGKGEDFAANKPQEATVEKQKSNDRPVNNQPSDEVTKSDIDKLSPEEKVKFNSWLKGESERRSVIGMSPEVPAVSIRRYLNEQASTKEAAALFDAEKQKRMDEAAKRKAAMTPEQLRREEALKESYKEADRLQYQEDLADWKRRKKLAENKGEDFDEEKPSNPDEDAMGNKYQEVDDTSVFVPETLKLLRKPETLAQSSEAKMLSTQSFKKRLSERVAKDELELLDTVGFNSFIESQGDRIDIAKTVKWLEDNAPKVNIVSYGMEGKVSEAKREYDELRHWQDSIGNKKEAELGDYLQDVLDNAPDEPKTQTDSLIKAGWSEQDIQKAVRYSELERITSIEKSEGPRATSAYDTVSAFDTKEPMPEWTKSKDKNNVQRVDVVIPEQGNKRWKELDEKVGNKTATSAEREEWYKRETGHIKDELWTPDNLHENLPNTLGWAMIQYKTGPKGEKIAVIAEAQSRWGQQARERGVKKPNITPDQVEVKQVHNGWEYKTPDGNTSVVTWAKNAQEAKEYGAKEYNLQPRAVEGHPLLRDYNRLILKAAIDQAKKEGATHIMVSDAETAMMTEGHDISGGAWVGKYQNTPRAKEFFKNWSNVTIKDDGIYVRDSRSEILQAAAKQIGQRVELKKEVEQELGMRLNYDTILPKIAEELTGSKGERVSLGEHKNSRETGYNGPGTAYTDIVQRKTRQDLIFKNSDGTPKTDVSGKLFAIDKIAARQQSGEQMSYFGKRYQDVEDTTTTTEIPRPRPQGKTAQEIRDNIENTLGLPAFKKAGRVQQGFRDLKTRLPIFGSDLDKLAARGGESGKYIAPAIKEALTKMDELEGRYYNPSVENIKSLKYDDQKLLIDTMRQEHRTNTDLRDTLPTEQLKAAYDIQRKLLKQKQEDQIAANQPVMEYVKGPRGGYKVIPREAKINPYYFPDIAGSKQLDIILNHEGSEAFDILKTDFINHIQDKYSFDRDTAAKLFEDYKGSFGGGPSGGGNATEFGAVRRAEGVGLPDSWLESDPAVTLRRYWRRVAKDRAWYDAVESDPNNLYILGYNKDAWGNTIEPTAERISRIPSNSTLTGIIDTVQGVNIKQNPTIDAVVRIANNLILGPLTGVNDIISALPVTSKFIPSFWDAPKVYAEAVANITTGIKNAKQTGRIKEKISNIEDIYFPATENVERLRQIGDGIAKISGREKLEEFSRGLAQAAGESIIRIHRGKAENGDAKSIKFLTELANKSNYTEMSDMQLASRIVDLTQGTYDVRGLPSWMINSQVAPLFRMMKWNVEQLNNLHKHVLIPAANGNLTPLIMSLTAGAVGGYLAKEVREKLSNKKLNVPSLAEIKNSEGSTKDKVHGATYAAAAAISYSGVLGLLGEVLKTIGDVSYKNKPHGLNFPAVEVITDVVDNISDASQAIIQEGEDPLKVLPELTKRLFTNNIQATRIILNWTGDKSEQNNMTDERRDLRVYKQLSGKNYAAQSTPQNYNPYVGMETKEFQKTDDLKKLIPESRRLVTETIQKTKGDPAAMKAGLQKLKSGAVTTFPSIDNAPDEFAKYYRYLVKVYGEQEAKERLKRYNKQRGINQVRRSLIPSLD